MSLDSSDLVLRASSFEVVGPSDFKLVVALSLLLFLLLGLDGGAIGKTIGVVECGIK